MLLKSQTNIPYFGRQRHTTVCVQAARRPLPGKQLNSKSLVQLTTSHETNSQLTKIGNSRANVAEYMELLKQDFGRLKMPLGAQLKKLTNDGYEIVAPKIQLFDVWVQPKSLAVLDFGHDYIKLESRDSLLSGSGHVQQYKLNDVFNMYVQLHLTWVDDGKPGTRPRVFSKGSMDVDVDVPFPFSALPKPALQATGNTAFKTTLSLMLDGYMQNLVKDYDAWARWRLAEAAKQAKK